MLPNQNATMLQHRNLNNDYRNQLTYTTVNIIKLNSGSGAFHTISQEIDVSYSTARMNIFNLALAASLVV